MTRRSFGLCFLPLLTSWSTTPSNDDGRATRARASFCNRGGAAALGAATEDLAVVASGPPVSVYGKRRVGGEDSGLLRRPSLLGFPGNAGRWRG
nr:hypothetical protein Itr_chr07CG08300 [Ipomoea trifida]GLL31353.1 hypothetical protein Itr_chr07CG08310 [Ipomoea trifida]